MAESLRFQLKNPNPQVREAAAMELVFAPNGEYLDDLLELLKDSDPDVLRTAILALGALNHPAALPGLREVLLQSDLEGITAAENAISKFGSKGRQALQEWLQHEEWPNRAAALRALHKSDKSDLWPEIIALTQDPVWEVRFEAYLRLGEAGHEAHLSLLERALQKEQHPQAREAVITALGSIQLPQACELLLHNFIDPYGSEFSASLASALSHYGERCHPILIRDGLWSPHAEIRSFSAALLAETGCPELEHHLLPLLLDPQPSVRQTVAFALFYSQPDKPFWEFVAGLYHPDESVFVQALEELSTYPDPEAGQRLMEALDLMLLSERAIPLIRALGKMSYEPAAAALVELLEIVPSQEEQLTLCATLGQLRAWRAYRPLQKLLGHPDSAIQAAAARALTEISPEEPEWREIIALEQREGKALQHLLQFVVKHPEARGLLLHLALKPEVPLLRAEIITILSSVRATELRALIEAWLKIHPEPEPETAGPILQALRLCGVGLKAAYILLKWLQQREEEIRLQVVHLLQAEQHTLQETLLNLSHDELWFVRQGALMILEGNEHPLVIKRLRECLQDRDRDVRITAVNLLGQLGSSASVEPLVEALENGYREIRTAAARALGKQQDKWVSEPLEIALVEDESADVRRAAAEALAEQQHEDLVDLLEDALQHEDDAPTMATYLRLLYQHDPDSARPWLLEALQNAEREPCAQALKLLNQEAKLSTAVLEALEQLLENEDPGLRSQALKLLLRQRPEQARRWLLQEDTVLQQACLQMLQPTQAEELQGELITLLASEDVPLRQDVLRVMARTPSLWPLLVHHAQQENDSSIQHILVELLTELPPEQSTKPLFALLQKGTIQLQKSVTWALIQLMNEGNSQVLQQALQSQLDPELRREVFAHLSRMGERALPLLETLTDSWDRNLMLMATRTLGHLGKVALPVLSRLWQSGEMTTQIAVLEALKNIRDPAVMPLLTEVANSPYDNLRTHAFETLILLGTIATPTLQKLAGHPQQSVRYDACRTLALMEPEHPAWLHLQGINSLLPQRRLQHLLALQEFFADEYFAYCWHLRHDPAYQMRQLFCETHVEGHPEWNSWLFKTLLGDVLPVRLAALQAMSRYPISAERKMDLISQWGESPILLKETLLAVLSQLGLPGQAMQALHEPSAWLRISAACVLGFHALLNARKALEETVRHDPVDEVRATAIWALGRLQQEESLELLAETCASSNQMIKYQSIVALGQSQSQRAAEMLLAILDSELSDVELLEEVVRGLAQHQFLPAVPRLIQFTLSQEDITLKTVALKALSRIPSDRAHSHLLEISRGPQASLARTAKELLALSH